MAIKLTENEVIQILNHFNIDHKGKSENGWIKVRCVNPSHADKHIGNASINVNSLTFKCFSCGYKSSLFEFLNLNLNLNFKNTLIYLKENVGINSIKIYKGNSKDTKKKDSPLNIERPQKKKREREKPFTKELEYNFSYIADFDINKYSYLTDRGYTKEYCHKRNIVVALSDWYEDYLITPIVDKERRVCTFEARKLLEREKIQEFLNTKEKDLKILRNILSEYCKNNNIEYKDYKMYKDNERIYDKTLEYLLKPRVLYEKNNNINNTIFKRNEIDKSKPLIISEGLGTIPKIEEITNNCTCIFGSVVSNKGKYNQMDILQEFDIIYWIPEYDYANDESLGNVNDYCNVKVLNCKSKDTDKDFVEKLRHSIKNPMSAYSFILNRIYN